MGSHLLCFLAETGCEVQALKRKESNLKEVKEVFLQYASGEELWERIIWVEGDVLEEATLVKSVASASCVFHCAAVVSFSGKDRDRLLEINLKGSRNIASLCLKYETRLCYVSSVGALGDARVPGECIREETPHISGREHSLYSGSKKESEDVVWEYIHRGLDAVVVNPSIILGAGQWQRSSSRLFVTASRGMPFYTNGGMGYVDVRDVCRLMLRLAMDREIKGERFILNGGNYSYKELFDEIARALGQRRPWINMRPWMTELAWRIMALYGKLSGKRPAFTRETARTSQHVSCYSSEKIKALYPDCVFYPLSETVQYITKEWKRIE